MSADPSPAPAARRTVLVVDDDRDLRETVQGVLEHEGFDVATASNGEEALTQLRHTPAPAVILLDLSMPIMDGITFRQHQQRDPSIAGVPVVIFSAAASVADKVRELDVHGVLRKPLKLAQLIETVTRFCGPAG